MTAAAIDLAPPAPPSTRAQSAEERDPEAVRYLKESGLALSSVVLALLDQSDDCIKLLDADGRLQFMNCNGKVAMEIDDFGLLVGADWSTLWPAETAPVVAAAVRAAKEGEVGRFEGYCPTAKGDPRWWDVMVSPVRGDDGAVNAILASSRDITERHRAHEAMASVASEMKHRLRNAYAIGAAITTASGREMPEHEPFAATLAGRLTRLAEVQAALLDDHAGLALSALIAPITRAYGQEEGQWDIPPLPPVTLGEKSARALALALGELATNSVKYGALGAGGTVRLEASLDAAGALRLDWRDRPARAAVLAPNAVTSRGHGIPLIARMLSAARGAIEQGRVEGGYDARITIGAPSL